MILQYNYLEVYVYDKWSDRNIPVFEEGEEFTPTSLRIHQGSTNPPALISEPELIQVMDENGIGKGFTTLLSDFECFFKKVRMQQLPSISRPSKSAVMWRKLKIISLHPLHWGLHLLVGTMRWVWSFLSLAYELLWRQI
jgi:hypothetical protein